MRGNPSSNSYANAPQFHNQELTGIPNQSPVIHSPGKFQQNAFMVMNSYQQGPTPMGLQMVPPSFQVPMGQVPYGFPASSHMMQAPQSFGNGVPGVYIVPQYPPQPQMMYAMPGMMGAHPSLGLRAAHTYFTSPNDMAEVQRKYGLTEQGDFKVEQALTIARPWGIRPCQRRR